MPAKLQGAYFGQTHTQEVIVLVTVVVTVAFPIITVVTTLTPISTSVTLVTPVISVVLLLLEGPCL